jgi:hypothetical protein
MAIRSEADSILRTAYNERDIGVVSLRKFPVPTLPPIAARMPWFVAAFARRSGKQ